jgi:hypothetical protein
MQVELQCPSCPCQFSAPSDTPSATILDRMTDEGPWFGLAQGETFEEMILGALAARGAVRCPECSGAVATPWSARRAHVSNC